MSICQVDTGALTISHAELKFIPNQVKENEKTIEIRMHTCTLAHLKIGQGTVERNNFMFINFSSVRRRKQ